MSDAKRRRQETAERDDIGRGAARALLVVLCLLSLWLNLHRLGERGFDFDEAISLYDTASTWGECVHRVLTIERAPPLFFFLLRAWRPLAGDGAFALRLPWALCGTASVVALYLLGRALTSRRTALLASYLLAVSLLQIDQARSVRMYSLLLLLSTLATAFLLRWLEEGSRRWQWAYVGAAVAALYVHYFAVLVVACHWLWYLLPYHSRQVSTRRWIGIQAIVALAFVPAFYFLIPQIRSVEGGFWIPKPGLGELVRTFFQFSSRTQDPLTALLFLLLILVALAPRVRRDVERRLEPPPRWRAVAFSFGYVFFPVGGTYLASQVGPAAYLERYLLPFVIGFYLLAALGAARLRRRWLRAVLVAALTFTLVPHLRMYYSYEIPNNKFTFVKQLAEYVSARYRPGEDLVLHESYEAYFPSIHYHRGKRMEEFLFEADRSAAGRKWGGMPLATSEFSFGRYRRVWQIAPTGTEPQATKYLPERLLYAKQFGYFTLYLRAR